MDVRHQLLLFGHNGIMQLISAIIYERAYMEDVWLVGGVSLLSFVVCSPRPEWPGSG